MRRWLILLLCAAALLGLRGQARAAQAQVISSSVDTPSAARLFSRPIPADLVLESAQVFLRSQGETETLDGDANLLPVRFPTPTTWLTSPCAFSTIEYWYRLQPRCRGL
jgi:hypothetical protein